MPLDTVVSCVTEDSTPGRVARSRAGRRTPRPGHHASLDAWPVRDGLCFLGWADVSVPPPELVSFPQIR